MDRNVLSDLLLDLVKPFTPGCSQIIVLLQIQPKLGRVAKLLCESKSRIGRDRALSLYNRQDTIGRNM
jgi:hypothetical protein